MDEITIGYLSWKRHDILKQTLESHRNNGLFNIIPPSNRMIFYQEISDADLAIADEYGLQVYGSDSNIGINGGFMDLVRRCKTKYFIFCENDWMLIEDEKVCREMLEDCTALLDQEDNCVVRLRHRREPGVPLYSRPSDVNEWLKNGSNGCPYKLESLSWLDYPCCRYTPGILTEHRGKHIWYMTTLDHQKWSNNVFIASTEWLKNILLPLVEEFQDVDKYSGLESILIDFNQHMGKTTDVDRLIENYKNVRLGAGDGLFTHQDRLV